MDSITSLLHSWPFWLLIVFHFVIRPWFLLKTAYGRAFTRAVLDWCRENDVPLPPEFNNQPPTSQEEKPEDPLKDWKRPQREECPICFLPFPIESSLSVYWSCCGQRVCQGCMVGHALANDCDEKKLAHCMFCRHHHTEEDCASTLKRELKLATGGNSVAMKRVNVVAMERVAKKYFNGSSGLKKNKRAGIKWYKRAMEAGSGYAAMQLGYCFFDGDGVVEDHDKALSYFEKAITMGEVEAYIPMGQVLFEKNEPNERVAYTKRGLLNWRKAAMCGYDKAEIFEGLRIGFKIGLITKEEYAYTLREHQVASDEMKSEAREFWKRKQEGGLACDEITSEMKGMLDRYLRRGTLKQNRAGGLACGEMKSCSKGKVRGNWKRKGQGV